MSGESFDPAKSARWLVHTAPEASLGTLSPDGAPHVSHVSAAVLTDGAPLVLISDLARHTANVRRDGRVSLLFVAAHDAALDNGDNNARGRVTVDGVLSEAPDTASARKRFLRRHPAAESYISFADFHLMRLEPSSAYLVAGFGRIRSLEPSAIMMEAEAAAAFDEMDEGACQHMDEDHADAMALIATRLCGAPDGEWRAVGMDPLGIDLAAGNMVVRAEFDAPLTSAGALRHALKVMTDAARNARQTVRTATG